MFYHPILFLVVILRVMKETTDGKNEISGIHPQFLKCCH
jgi:hypothetical protein